MKALTRLLVLTLSFSLVMTPGLWAAVDAEPSPTVTIPAVEVAMAPQNQVDLLKRLSKLEPLEVLKPWGSKKKLTETDVTDALVAAFPVIQALDASVVKGDDSAFSPEDWNALLQLVRDKKGALRARKVSAWSYEKKLEKIVSLASDESATATVSSEKPASATPTPGPPPADAATRSCSGRTSTVTCWRAGR